MIEELNKRMAIQRIKPQELKQGMVFKGHWGAFWDMAGQVSHSPAHVQHNCTTAKWNAQVASYKDHVTVQSHFDPRYLAWIRTNTDIIVMSGERLFVSSKPLYTSEIEEGDIIGSLMYYGGQKNPSGLIIKGVVEAVFPYYRRNHATYWTIAFNSAIGEEGSFIKYSYEEETRRVLYKKYTYKIGSPWMQEFVKLDFRI